MRHLLQSLLASAYTLDPNGIVPTKTNNIGTGLTSVINLLLTLIGGLSVIFMVVGGLMIALASGNPARYKQGRETVLYAAIGLVVALSAYAIVLFVTGQLA